MTAVAAGDSSTKRSPQTTTAVFGTLVFLASDLMLFAGFFAAYFMLRGQAPTWPPEGVELDVGGAVLGTVLLLVSSATMHQASVAFRRKQMHNARRWLAVTAVLGAAFAVNQIRDFLTVDFSISDHAYGAIYWSATGLHGLHVIAGVGLLMLLGWRVATGTASDASMISTAYFWHLVDVVWVALFVVIWVLQ